MKLKIAILVILLCAAGTRTHLFADMAMYGTEVILQQGVVDLRGNPHMRKAGLGGPSGFHTARELAVGTIFITEDNVARKVSAIYIDRGKTVIETVTPNIEEVLVTAYIPDQEIPITAADIDPQSLREGVRVVDTATADAMLAASGVRAQSTMEQNAKWLETDPEWMGKNVIAVSVDFPIVSNKPGAADKVTDWLKDLETDKSSSDGDGGGGDSDSDSGSGKSSFDAGVTGEVRLTGILRLAEPIVKTGVKKPVLKVTWVKVWWYVYYPKVEFEDGYLHASFKAAQQFDFKLSASVTLEAELKIPLYMIVVPIAKVGKFEVGVYVKITLEGTITLAFEVSEYTSVSLWGTVDLFWPFIPYNIRMGGDNYANFAVRPSLAAEIENKNGIYLGFDLQLLGLSILGAEVGGGVYQTVEGYMESKGIIGYATGYGGYGNIDDWVYKINYELGGYVEAGLNVAFVEVDLFDFRWPFLELEWRGEF